MPNARTSERVPFVTEVDVLAAGAPGPRRVWGSDVSDNGIFLETTHPFRVGDRVSLRFEVDNTEVHIRAAEVRWVRPFDPLALKGQMPGAGLKFIAIDAMDRAALRQHVLPKLRGVSDQDERADGVSPIAEPFPAESACVANDLDDTLPPDSGDTTLLDGLAADMADEMAAYGRDAVRDTLEPTDAASDGGTESHTRGAQPAPISLSPIIDEDEEVSPPRISRLPGLALSFEDQEPSRAMEALSSHVLTETSAEKDSAPLEALFRSRELSAPPAMAAGVFPEESRDNLSLSEPPVDSLRRRLRVETGSTWLLPVAVGLLCSGVVVALNGRSELPADVETGHAGDLAVHMPAVPLQEGLAQAPSAQAQAQEENAMRPAGNEPTLTGLPAADASLSPTPSAQPPRTLPPTQPAAGFPEHAAHVEPTAISGDAAAAAPAAARTARALVASPAAEPSAAAILGSTAPRAKPPSPSTLASTVRPAKPGSLPPADAPQTFSLAVGTARVVRSFALASPARLVVDLEGARLPETPPAAGGRIAKVRFGSPSAGIQRIVLEMDDKKPVRDLAVRVASGALRVRFR